MSSEQKTGTIFNERLVVSVIIFTIMVLLLIKTFAINNPSARTLPFIIAIPTVIFCAVDIVRVLKKNLKERNAEKVLNSMTKDNVSTARELIAFGSFAAYIAFVWLFSFLVISPIFTFLMSKLFFKSSYKFAAVSAMIVYATVYLLFFKLLGIYGVGKGTILTIT